RRGSRRVSRGREADAYSCDERDQERGAEHARVGMNVELYGEHDGQLPAAERSCAECRREDAEAASEHCQDNRFGEKLSNETAAACADRQPDGELTLAIRATGRQRA